jgi:lysyl-tRNA synthetase class 2
MEDYNELIQQRFKKLAEINEMGTRPYAGRYAVTASAQGLIAAHGTTSKETLEKERVTATIAGRIVALRSFGKACFCHIQDGSGRIQLYFQKNTLGEEPFSLFKKLDIGDFIGVTGFLFRTRTDELTLDVERFDLLAKSLRPLPEKWHGLTDVEIRYRQRYRPHRQSRGQTGLPHPHEDHPVYPVVPQQPRVPRSRDPHDAEHTRRGNGAPVQDPP